MVYETSMQTMLAQDVMMKKSNNNSNNKYNLTKEKVCKGINQTIKRPSRVCANLASQSPIKQTTLFYNPQYENGVGFIRAWMCSLIGMLIYIHAYYEYLYMLRVQLKCSMVSSAALQS
ncbi:hypothetical protein GQX74_012991 [Glossina fuscipes]|nr:hypothetical protein GQX74_012991 [Glossina fuscipes]